MILGLGCDVVNLERFREALTRSPRVAERLFTTQELASCGANPASLAARFAAKEAILKALGEIVDAVPHLRPESWTYQDMEILRSPSGIPHLRLHGGLAEAARKAGVGAWHVSLSHDHPCAMATVIAESA